MRGYLEDTTTDIPQHRILSALHMFQIDNDLHVSVATAGLPSAVVDYETLSRL
jgi:hypothetical protein